MNIIKEKEKKIDEFKIEYNRVKKEKESVLEENLKIIL